MKKIDLEDFRQSFKISKTPGLGIFSWHLLIFTYFYKM